MEVRFKSCSTTQIPVTTTRIRFIRDKKKLSISRITNSYSLIYVSCAMGKFILVLVFIAMVTSHDFTFGQPAIGVTTTDHIKLSENFLYAAKTGDTTKNFTDTLKNANEDLLATELSTDHKRLAFWLNIYNGFTQVILRNDPGQYKSRNAFFSSRQIIIAGKRLSLDDIEHGILRHSTIKWSEGYLSDLLPSSFERKFRVAKLDYRIHFALNCGAKSCPPIAFYEPTIIDKQLTLAAKVYLKGECTYDAAKNTVEVPALMGWFRHDFGGKSNMLDLLKQNKIIPQDSNPIIHFKKYDWSLYLNNFKSENNG
jgi:hypothetical protein